MAETTSFLTADEPDEHLYSLPPDYLSAPLYEPGGLEAVPEVAETPPSGHGGAQKGHDKGSG